MSSTTKTLALLAHFTPALPEIGLTQLCRLANRDKATTYRHLQTLEEAGFVEQNPTTKRYRLGPIVLQLAQTREVTVPRKAGAEPALLALSTATSETAHVSILSGTTLYALASCESPKHSTRAIIDLRTLPLHATASGLCTLAFGPPALMDAALANMESFTANTAQTSEELHHNVQSARDTGFGRSNRCLEDEIYGLSVPIFDQTGQLAGAVSVASVATRFTPESEYCIQRNLILASRQITYNWGGRVPTNIEAIWANSLNHSHTLEFAT